MASGNSDNSFSSMWLVVTVLAALGIAVPVLPKVTAVRPATLPAPGTAREPSAKQESEEAGGDIKTPIEIIADCYGLVLPPGPPYRNMVEDVCFLRTQIARQIHRCPRIGFVIATLPDPVDSHLQTSFDLSVGSIQLACQRHGYILDRYSFPWQRRVQEKSGLSVASPVYTRIPGALVFRPFTGNECGQPNDLIVVLLVGETPISGVHRAAFDYALSTVYAFTKGGLPAASRCASSPMLVLGPSTSGAGESLAAGIRRWYANQRLPREALNVQVVSGSALAIKPETINTHPASPDDEQLTIGFRATVIPGVVLNEVLIDYLERTLGIPEWKIAQVAESGTGYGAASGRDVGQFHGRLLTLTYPVEVGRLRSEYERDPLLKFSATRQDAMPTRGLRLSLEEPPYARDTTPAYSSLGPALTERRLETMFETISRRGIKAAILTATDPRDLLFVAKQMREHCPDVRLCTTESHLLYTHPDCNATFRGMLVATTYPLFLETQAWMGRPKQYQFSSGSSEGVNNAMSALLHQLVTPRKPQTLLDFQVPFTDSRCGSHARPPVWISVVGQDSIWPLHACSMEKLPQRESPSKEKQELTATMDEYLFVDESTKSSLAAIPIEQLFGAIPTPIHAILGSLVCMLAGVFLAAANHRSIRHFGWTYCGASLQYLAVALRRLLRNKLAWARVHAPYSDKPWRPSDGSFYAGVFFASLLALLLLLLLPPVLVLLWWASALPWQRVGWQWPILAATALILMVLSEVLVAPFALADRRTRQRRAMLAVVCFAVVGVVAAALAGSTYPYLGTHADALSVVLLSVEATLMASAAVAVTAINLSRNPYANEQGGKVVGLFLRDAFGILLLTCALVTFAAFGGIGTTEVYKQITAWAVPSLAAATLVGFVAIVFLNPRIGIRNPAISPQQRAPAREVTLSFSKRLSTLLRLLPVWVVGPVVVAALVAELAASGADSSVRLQFAMAAKRYGTYSSSVSPLSPLLLVFVLAACWSLANLRRAWSARHGWLTRWLRDAEALRLSIALDETHERLAEFNPRRWHTRDVAFVVLAFGLLLYILLVRWIPTPEGKLFDWLIVFSLLAGLAMVMEVFLRVRLASASFQQFLDALEEHALAPAFSIIPERFKRRAGLYFLAPPMHAAEQQEIEAARKRLLSLPVVPPDELAADEATRFQNTKTAIDKLKVNQESTISILFEALAKSEWPQRAPLDVKEGRYSYGVGEWTLAAWYTEAQRLLAIELSLVLRDVFSQVRNLLVALVICVLLYLWMLGSYPFQPQRLLGILSYGVVLWIVGSLAVRFAKLNRNGILSVLAGNEANRLSWDRTFVVPMLLYVAVPLLGLLASQFPEVSGLLSDWASSLQQALKS